VKPRGFEEACKVLFCLSTFITRIEITKHGYHFDEAFFFTYETTHLLLARSKERE